MTEETLPDQTLVCVDAGSYQHYLEVLDLPPSGEGFERLMRASKPWPMRLSAPISLEGIHGPDQFNGGNDAVGLADGRSVVLPAGHTAEQSKRPIV